jgi:DNA polymerase
MADVTDRDGMLALLAWWREAGVSDALDEVPLDWTAEPGRAPGAAFDWPEKSTSAPEGARVTTGTQAPAAERAPHIRGPAAPAPPAGRDPQPTRRAPTQVASARNAARSAETLVRLQELLQSFDGCPLKVTAKSLCFYRGSETARVAVIGEAPGREEDLAGKPFVGRAGQLLDRMLAAIGLAESDVHITNIVYWRPPGNRTPTPEEAQACRPFLERQLELVAPEFILTLGGPAAKAILDVNDGILKLRGRWREVRIGSHSVRVMPTLHPAYLLRQPEAKRQAWRDLLQLKAALDGQTGSPSP